MKRLFFICVKIGSILKGVSSVAKNDIIDWNKNELNNIPNESHNKEAHETGLQYLGVFCSVWSCAFIKEIFTVFIKLGKVVNDSL